MFRACEQSQLLLKLLKGIPRDRRKQRLPVLMCKMGFDNFADLTFKKVLKVNSNHNGRITQLVTLEDISSVWYVCEFA